jgi:hypothetical protein
MSRPNLPPSLTLSHEELILLLKLFGARTIPGLPSNPFPGLPEEQVNLLIASAERNLRARGLLFVSPEGKITVERFVLALLGPCVAPEFSCVALRARKGGQVDLVYFHAAQMMTVEHIVSGPGLHTFAALKDRQAMFNRLVAFVNLDGQPLRQAPAGQVSAGALTQGIQAAVQEIPSVQNLLASGAQESEFHRSLAEDLSQFAATSRVVAIQHTIDGQVTAQNYAFIESSHALWEFTETGDTEASLVDLKPVSGGAAKNRLWKIVVG